MRYGNFDDERREYVVNTPTTPFPWINYLGSERFFSIISHRAGGYSFYQDARLRRLSRFRYNNIPPDLGGRYLYLNVDGDLWTPSYAPVGAELDFFEARHGMGYTRITGERSGIRASSLFFVPVGMDAEIQKVTLSNTSDQTRTVKVFTFLEFCLWDAWDDQTNYQRNLSLAEVEVQGGGSEIYHVTEYRERRNHYALSWVGAPTVGFDTDRDSFLGFWGTLDAPQVPLDGKPSNSIAHGWYPIASHALEFTLDPQQSVEFVIGLGYLENPRESKWEAPGVIRKDGGKALIAAMSSAAQADQAFAELREHWEGLLSSFQLSSGDDQLNRLVNTWNQYQCMVTFNLSRSATFFDTGIGRGMGFRDSSQDLLGFVHMVPARARERLLDIAATQLPDGSAYHQYQPLTKRGNDAIGSGFNDDPLWLVYASVAYLKETGDFSILDERVPFDNDESLAAPLLTHLARSLNHVTDNLGPHGLPLIGRADWNDCLNLNCFSEEPGESFQTTGNRTGGVAESLVIAGMFTQIAPEFARLAELLGESELANAALAATAQLRAAISEHGWDGEWFLRAYDYFGVPVGTNADVEAKIFSESQGLCVMGGNGLDDGRAEAALESVAQLLAGPHGIALLHPTYSGYRMDRGEISSYPPGVKENGSVFCHNNLWIVIAETMLGHADRAFDYFRRSAPAYREGISEVHRLEPYVYSQMIAGPASPKHGEAKNSWLTGTAAWAFTAVSQHILGIRADFSGLVIDPCVPAELGDYTVNRRFRGADYTIEVRNPGAGRKGRLQVNGQPIEGNLVPAAPCGAKVHVRWEGQAA
ncbi:MAG: hypothetical protein LBK28_02245 [Propionibacteriaceae bacterium]|jgi:cellobiose phosphorylase|nr:hypothetical protein [Propionibacteriaceae bacterium]